MSVVIAPYSEEWPAQFAVVREELVLAFASQPVAVEHVGSTSVPGLAAKPIIDVLLGAASLGTVEAAIPSLARFGYEYVPKYEVELPLRRYFVKAASALSLRVNLHCAVQDSIFWAEHIAFRDALRSSPILLSQYQEQKLELAVKFVEDRPAYTAAKAPFIQTALSSALAYADRKG